jgi:hypothetical protein
MPKVSIAVQSYKNPEMLSLCLRSVREHCAQIDHELIVADCATEDVTIAMMREDFPEAIFIPHEKNVGFSALVNACIDHAQGEYVFFINPDTILEAETVPQLITFMDLHTRVALCGPRQKNFNGKVENTRFRFYQPMTIVYRRTFLKKFAFAKKHLAHFEMKDVERTEPYPVEWVIGSAMFVRRSAMEEVGKMDSRFFMYMEDVDWCRRFWEKGYIVCYNPQVTMYHFYGKGSAKGGFFRGLFFNRLTWIHIASGIKYFRKYRNRPLPDIVQKI